MGHHHNHHSEELSSLGEKSLLWAVAANVLLTVAQVIGGLLSGSLSLIADALHNFSDAASLFIALIAIRIGRKPADELKTFGYKRAETIAALINLTSLIIIGLYLIVEAIQRFINPQPIDGWMVIIVAGIALAVDVFTALLTFAHSKSSMNMKAVFLHNLTDALTSLGVIVVALLIILYGWVWADAVLTLVIAGYVLWQGFTQMPKAIHILMEGAPTHIVIEDVIAALERQEGVQDAHHVHLWQLDEHRNALEAHIVLDDQKHMDSVKENIKRMLHEDFGIDHSTLEFENVKCG